MVLSIFIHQFYQSIVVQSYSVLIIKRRQRNWSINNKINSKIDAGDILGQYKFKINKNSNFEELHNSLSSLGSKLMIEVINKIEKNKINPIKQNKEYKTLAQN